MNEFVVTLHVLAVVLVVGPLVLAGLTGYTAVRRHDPAGARFAASIMARSNIGLVVAVLFGFWAVSTSDRYTFRTPWIIISITLWVIMGAVASALGGPGLRKAARILEEGVPARPQVTAPDDEGATPAALTTTATEMVAKERLDHLAGRIAASSALVALAAVAITVFMVVKPFGN
jgi:hypothetical protein